MPLIDRVTRQPVKEGVTLYDMRGDAFILVTWEPPLTTESTGRVRVRVPGTDPKRYLRLYPSVFNLEITP